MSVDVGQIITKNEKYKSLNQSDYQLQRSSASSKRTFQINYTLVQNVSFTATVTTSSQDFSVQWRKKTDLGL